MKSTTSTPKMTSQPTSATPIHTPQLPHNYERISKRAEELCAARNGMIGMTLNDWLKAEQELKQELEKQITNK
jgi:SLT domain-containing protein